MAKILIVDDEPEILQLFEFILQRAGHTVSSAADSQSAISHISSEKPDLVLLDLMLPGEGGYNILKRLEIDPLLSKIPVLVITARDLSRGQAEMLLKEPNVAALLTKPVQPDVLAEKVKEVLEKP